MFLIFPLLFNSIKPFQVSILKFLFYQLVCVHLFEPGQWIRTISKQSVPKFFMIFSQTVIDDSYPCSAGPTFELKQTCSLGMFKLFIAFLMSAQFLKMLPVSICLYPASNAALTASSQTLPFKLQVPKPIIGMEFPDKSFMVELIAKDIVLENNEVSQIIFLAKIFVQNIYFLNKKLNRNTTH